MARIGIFVGTVYGNALLVAEDAQNILKTQGHDTNLYEEGTLQEWQEYHDHCVLIITSSTGQGNLPDSIVPLYQEIKEKLGLQSQLRYGMIALGDRSYQNFCGAGHQFDELLQQQQATRLGELLEIDALTEVEPEKMSRPWVENWGQQLEA